MMTMTRKGRRSGYKAFHLYNPALGECFFCESRGGGSCAATHRDGFIIGEGEGVEKLGGV